MQLCFFVKILENVHVFLHFGMNRSEVNIVSENVNEVRWHVVPRLFLEKLHNLLRFCVHFSTNFANNRLSEMILLRGDLGKITFDVGSRVQEYMRTLPPP